MKIRHNIEKRKFLLNFNFDQLTNLSVNQLRYLKTTYFWHICDQYIKVHHNMEKRKFLTQFQFLPIN